MGHKLEFSQKMKGFKIVWPIFKKISILVLNFKNIVSVNIFMLYIKDLSKNLMQTINDK